MAHSLNLISIMGKTFNSEQLELVVQKKKIAEVRSWFQTHFTSASHAEYIARSPIVIFQGPTGCGKTSVLKCIANELKLSIKEYSETTDTTAINYDLNKTFSDEERENLSHSINSRKAHKFEHFVIYSLRYNTLYPPNDFDEAGSEFDSDEDCVPLPGARPPPTPLNGLVIHVETPLSFARSQRILINSICRIIKTIREVSKHTLRRIAVVFETLEGEGESICLPSKVKSSLLIQTIKFNPVTKANMKKLVEFAIKDYKNIVLDKDAVEQLVNDCDGDIRACVNTIKMLCNKSTNSRVSGVINGNNLSNEFYPPIVMPFNKKQKISHEKAKQIELKAGLMRVNTKSLNFFHVLGKIFYQKRLYPVLNDQQTTGYRPKTENSTEYLASMVDVEPKNLKAWLHQHYYKFCHKTNIAKAALFLENHSTVDTISLDSLQTSQFYEIHHTLDQIQTHLAIESTVYSLYEDQSNSIIKPSHRKTPNDHGMLVKSSVGSYNSTPNSSDLYSFTRPVTMILPKLVEDYKALLNCGTSRLIESTKICLDPVKVLVDYVPYLNEMCNSWALIQSKYRGIRSQNDLQRPTIFEDDNLCRIFKTLNSFDTQQETDLENRHDQLTEMIEEVEHRQNQAIM